jgi:SAM-dependent methyltransferase
MEFEVYHSVRGNFSGEEKFDVIIASHVVYYFENLELSIKKMISLLNTHGRLYFVVNGKLSDYGLIKNAFSGFIKKPYVFTYDILKKELESYNVKEYTLKSSLNFSSHNDLYDTLKLSFDLYPIEYKEQKTNIIKWIKDNIKGNSFFIDQIIFEVTK